MRCIIFIIFLFMAHTAYAACPSVASDCPSPTFNNVTVGGAVSGLTSTTVTSTGANAARSFGDHFSDIINALDFGAKFDGVTDDSAAIQAGLNYLETLPYGGTLLLPVGNAAICSSLTVNKSNIHIKGVGVGNSRHDVGSSGVGANTALTWCGSAGQTMLTMAPDTDPVNGQNLTNTGITGVRLDCNSSAGTGLLFKSISQSYVEVYVTECTSVDVSLDTVSLGEFNDVQNNEFFITFLNTSTSGIGLLLDGTGTSGVEVGNPSFNRFRRVQGRIKNGNGIQLNFADNNVFDAIKITVASGGTGIPILFNCSNASVGKVAYANEIDSYSSNGTAISRGTSTCTYPAHDNVINHIDEANSTPLPTVETGSNMTNRFSNGHFQSLSVGPAGSGANVFVLGGAGNGAAADDAVVLGGSGNFANGFGTAVGGQNSVCDGTDSLVFGFQHTCHGNDAFVVGKNANDRNRNGISVLASGNFSTNGDAQRVSAVLHGTGNSTSAIRLTGDGAAASTSNCLNLPSDGMIQSSNHVVTIFDATTSQYAIWTLQGAGISRGTGAASTAIAGTAFPSWSKTSASNATASGWSAPTMTADTTNACMNISWTPPGANTDTFRVVDSISAGEVQ